MPGLIVMVTRLLLPVPTASIAACTLLYLPVPSAATVAVPVVGAAVVVLGAGVPVFRVHCIRLLVVQVS